MVGTLQPFTVVRELHLPETLAQHFAQNKSPGRYDRSDVSAPKCFIRGSSGKLRSDKEAVDQFLTARQLSNLPVTVHHQE